MRGRCFSQQHQHAIDESSPTLRAAPKHKSSPKRCCAEEEFSLNEVGQENFMMMMMMVIPSGSKLHGADLY